MLDLVIWTFVLASFRWRWAWVGVSSQVPCNLVPRQARGRLKRPNRQASLIPNS